MFQKIKDSMYVDCAVVKEYLQTVIKRDKGYIVLMLIFACLGAGITAIDTLLIKYVVDGLTLNEPIAEIFPYILAGVLSSAVLTIFNAWIKQRIEYKNMELVHYFELRISNKIMLLKYEDIDNPDILEKKDKALFPVRNQNAIAVFLNDILNIMQSGFSLISLCVILFTLDIWLMFIIFLLILADIWIFSKVQEAEYEFFKVIIEDNRELNYYKNITTDFKYGKDIRLFGFSSLISKKINDYIDISTEKFSRANQKVGKYNSHSAVLSVIRTALVYGYVAFKVLQESIGIGSFAMYVYAVTAFSDLFSKVFLNVIEMKQYCKFLFPYFEFEKMQSIEEVFGEEKAGDSFEVTFEDVSFKYPDQEKYAIRSVSFTIKNNEIVSLVGVNGSGKSTIIKLLCGLYQPTKGRILINGKNICDYDYTDYIDKLAVVFQDYKIFAASISENIVFDREIPKEQLYSILNKVGLSEKIEGLEKKEDTPVSRLFYQDGIELSGGMEQRLAIGRALVKNFRAIILDEPTSALDPVKENEIMNDMRSLALNKTAIFVTHSMASCLWADKIIVMKDGCLEEMGTHKELMNKGGEYEKLFSMQASFYV